MTDDAGRIEQAVNGGSRQGLVATSGIFGALAASACCLLPLGLTLAGVSGAWMANLRALAPYQPIFIAFTAAMLGYGFYLVYWKPKRAYAEGMARDRPLVPARAVRAALWIATVIVTLSLTFAYWFPLIVPYLP